MVRFLSEEVVAAAVTYLSGNWRVEDGVDGQVQRNHAVATVDGLQRVAVSACSGKILPEEVVAAALADRSGDRRVDDIIDRQGQRNHAVAAVDALQRVGISARRGNLLSEEVVAAALANFSGDRGVEDGVDRQGQRNHAVATVDGLQRVGVGSGSGKIFVRRSCSCRRHISQRKLAC